jgi:signal transduction histidine kinase
VALGRYPSELEAAERGAGFVNMRDRLGAIGGWPRVESPPSAETSVLRVLPLAR